MPSVIYDIAIIGAGASGLQLLYESLQADSKKEMKILLLVLLSDCSEHGLII